MTIFWSDIRIHLCVCKVVCLTGTNEEMRGHQFEISKRAIWGGLEGRRGKCYNHIISKIRTILRKHRIVYVDKIARKYVGMCVSYVKARGLVSFHTLPYYF